MVQKDDNGFMTIKLKSAMFVLGGITLCLTVFFAVGSWACGIGTYTEKCRQLECQVDGNTTSLNKLNDKLGNMERSMTAVEKDIGWIRKYMEKRDGSLKNQ